MRRDSNYESSLQYLNLTTLYDRRNLLCLTFGEKKTLKNKKMQKLFHFRKERRCQERRKTEKFKVNKVHTERLRVSAMPYIQRLLNSENQRRRKTLN